MMSDSTVAPGDPAVLGNGTDEWGNAIGGSNVGTTVLVSGWAQLTVCILIVMLCCCCTLLCMCTSSMCCTNSTGEEESQVDHVTVTEAISDKPPSYDEAQKTVRNGLPSYQEAVRRESQVSWIILTSVYSPPPQFCDSTRGDNLPRISS